MHLILQRKKREMTAQLRAQAMKEQASRSAAEGGWKDTTSKPATAATPATASSILSKKPKGRPTTPNLIVDEHGESLQDDRAFQAAVILLQSLIRGRAIQNIMFEGKYRRRELIAELRDVDEYRAAMADLPSDFSNENEEIEKKKERDDRIRKSTIDAVGGGVTNNLFVALAQEQERLESFAQVQAIAEAAIKERRDLEAAEAGRRQRQNMKYPGSTE
jgi:hypothetical protein